MTWTITPFDSERVREAQEEEPRFPVLQYRLYLVGGDGRWPLALAFSPYVSLLLSLCLHWLLCGGEIHCVPQPTSYGLSPRIRLAGFLLLLLLFHSSRSLPHFCPWFRPHWTRQHFLSFISFAYFLTAVIMFLFFKWNLEFWFLLSSLFSAVVLRIFFFFFSNYHSVSTAQDVNVRFMLSLIASLLCYSWREHTPWI